MALSFFVTLEIISSLWTSWVLQVETNNRFYFAPRTITDTSEVKLNTGCRFLLAKVRRKLSVSLKRKMEIILPHRVFGRMKYIS